MPPGRLAIYSFSKQYLGRLKQGGQLYSPPLREPWCWILDQPTLLAWDHHTVALRRWQIVMPQAFRISSCSLAVWMPHNMGSCCLPGVPWQSRKPKEFLTAWLVFWRELRISGNIRDSCGRTELNPCSRCPWRSVAAVLVFPRWLIPPDHNFHHSVWLKSSSGSRSWPAWNSETILMIVNGCNRSSTRNHWQNDQRCRIQMLGTQCLREG